MFKYIIILTILSSCAPIEINSYDIRNICKSRVVYLQPEMNVRIDNSFSTKQIEIIKSAFIKWEKAINNLIIFNFKIVKINESENLSWDCDGITTVYNGTERNDWRSGPADELTAGATFLDTKDVFITTNKFFNKVVLHEVGHVLTGKYHSSYKEDIMYPKALNNDFELTARDKTVGCIIVSVDLYPHIPEKLLNCSY